MIKNTHLPFLKTIFASTILITLAGLIQMSQTAKNYNIDILHTSWLYLLSAVAGLVLLAIILLIVSLTKWEKRLLALPDSLVCLPGVWKVLAIIIFISLLPIYSLITLHPYLGHYYAYGSWSHLALFWWLAIVAMCCLKIGRKNLSWPLALGIAAIAQGVVGGIAITFSAVNNYPLSLSWSETSRYYGASLLFSERVYGVKLPLSVLHPAWHLLLAVPFLFGNLPIWVHRFWQAFLVVGLLAGFGLSFTKRLGLRDRLLVWIVPAWVYLFISQGPVIIHLLFCALTVMWGVAPGKFWRTSVVVFLASIWAGLCRINWFPVPGILAAVIYLLEVPLGSMRRFSYLWKPALWFLAGTLTAFISNFLYMQWSGNGPGGNFASSLSSDLLWYRLWPNPTYPHGILPDLLLVSAPAVLIIILTLVQRRGLYHPLRLAGVFAALAVLLLGGLVVSVKIGGGSDLHNLDAYLLLLMVVGGYFFFNRIVPEQAVKEFIVVYNIVVVALAIIIPIWMLIQADHSIFTWDEHQANQTIQMINENATRVNQKGGQVLFISQRQLLALKMVDVPLVPVYEQDFLMEMVMSHNRAYLDRFQTDLRSQRFGLIIATSQNINYYGNTRTFGVENDLWVQEISIPLLCYYEPIPSGEIPSATLYIPRQQPCN